MEGETVKSITPEIGLLTRGTEKLMEFLAFPASIPYMSRLDYVSTLAMEMVLVSTVETALNVGVSQYCAAVRTIGMELSRVLNHMLAITTHAIDLGAITPLL
jgi:NADH:ubiquinone oxidoreductase subunit D